MSAYNPNRGSIMPPRPANDAITSPIDTKDEVALKLSRIKFKDVHYDAGHVQRTSPMSYKPPSTQGKGPYGSYGINSIPEPTLQEDKSTINSAIGYIASPLLYVSTMFSGGDKEAGNNKDKPLVIDKTATLDKKPREVVRNARNPSASLMEEKPRVARAPRSGNVKKTTSDSALLDDPLMKPTIQEEPRKKILYKQDIDNQKEEKWKNVNGTNKQIVRNKRPHVPVQTAVIPKHGAANVTKIVSPVVQKDGMMIQNITNKAAYRIQSPEYMAHSETNKGRGKRDRNKKKRPMQKYEENSGVWKRSDASKPQTHRVISNSHPREENSPDASKHSLSELAPSSERESHRENKSVERSVRSKSQNKERHHGLSKVILKPKLCPDSSEHESVKTLQSSTSNTAPALVRASTTPTIDMLFLGGDVIEVENKERGYGGHEKSENKSPKRPAFKSKANDDQNAKKSRQNKIFESKVNNGPSDNKSPQKPIFESNRINEASDNESLQKQTVESNADNLNEENTVKESTPRMSDPDDVSEILRQIRESPNISPKVSPKMSAKIGKEVLTNMTHPDGESDNIFISFFKRLTSPNMGHQTERSVTTKEPSRKPKRKPSPKSDDEKKPSPIPEIMASSILTRQRSPSPINNRQPSAKTQPLILSEMQSPEMSSPGPSPNTKIQPSAKPQKEEDTQPIPEIQSFPTPRKPASYRIQTTPKTEQTPMTQLPLTPESHPSPQEQSMSEKESIPQVLETPARITPKVKSPSTAIQSENPSIQTLSTAETVSQVTNSPVTKPRPSPTPKTQKTSNMKSVPKMTPVPEVTLKTPQVSSKMLSNTPKSAMINETAVEINPTPHIETTQPTPKGLEQVKLELHNDEEHMDLCYTKSPPSGDNCSPSKISSDPVADITKSPTPKFTVPPTPNVTVPPTPNLTVPPTPNFKFSTPNVTETPTPKNTATPTPKATAGKTPKMASSSPAQKAKPASTPKNTASAKPKTLAAPTPAVATIETPKNTAVPQTPKCTADPSAMISAELTPKVAANPTPMKTAVPTPKIKSDPTPKITAYPTPKITADPTPNISDDSTAKVTMDSNQTNPSTDFITFNPPEMPKENQEEELKRGRIMNGKPVLKYQNCNKPKPNILSKTNNVNTLLRGSPINRSSNMKNNNTFSASKLSEQSVPRVGGLGGAVTRARTQRVSYEHPENSSHRPSDDGGHLEFGNSDTIAIVRRLTEADKGAFAGLPSNVSFPHPNVVTPVEILDNKRIRGPTVPPTLVDNFDLLPVQKGHKLMTLTGVEVGSFAPTSLPDKGIAPVNDRSDNTKKGKVRMKRDGTIKGNTKSKKKAVPLKDLDIEGSVEAQLNMFPASMKRKKPDLVVESRLRSSPDDAIRFNRFAPAAKKEKKNTVRSKGYMFRSGKQNTEPPTNIKDPVKVLPHASPTEIMKSPESNNLQMIENIIQHVGEQQEHWSPAVADAQSPLKSNPSAAFKTGSPVKRSTEQVMSPKQAIGAKKAMSPVNVTSPEKVTSPIANMTSSSTPQTPHAAVASSPKNASPDSPQSPNTISKSPEQLNNVAPACAAIASGRKQINSTNSPQTLNTSAPGAINMPSPTNNKSPDATIIPAQTSNSSPVLTNKQDVTSSPPAEEVQINTKSIIFGWLANVCFSEDNSHRGEMMP